MGALPTSLQGTFVDTFYYSAPVTITGCGTSGSSLHLDPPFHCWLTLPAKPLFRFFLGQLSTLDFVFLNISPSFAQYFTARQSRFLMVRVVQINQTEAHPRVLKQTVPGNPHARYTAISRNLEMLNTALEIVSYSQFILCFKSFSRPLDS